MTCSSSEGWQYGTASHGPLPNVSWQKPLSGLVCEWLTKPRPSVLFILWADAQECVLHSTCPRACTSQYTPIGYWLIQALGHVLVNTHFWVSSLRKTESVFENTLGKVRGTWRVKIKYITFKNWIMYNTHLQTTLGPCEDSLQWSKGQLVDSGRIPIVSAYFLLYTVYCILYTVYCILWIV